MSSSSDITAPPYRYTITGPTVPEGAGKIGSSANIWVRLVRLHEFVPKGEIISAPDVTVTFTNVAGGGPALTTGTVLSGVSVQPQITACVINAPTEIHLPPIYGNNLRNGAQGVTDVPTVTLTKCPGAINGITYDFAAVYGTHKASDGVLNTATGEGYANNVYVQVQNADGTAHIVNGDIAINGYNGSGNYPLPDFKVAYYIDDASTVTAGNVKSAIELRVSYN